MCGEILSVGKRNTDPSRQEELFPPRTRVKNASQEVHSHFAGEDIAVHFLWTSIQRGNINYPQPSICFYFQF